MLFQGEGFLNVVMGAVWCDLDSMVSSLAQAYFNDLVSKSMMFAALQLDKLPYFLAN